MKITAEMLESEFACETGLSEFKRVFPAGAEITEENIKKSQAEGLQTWFISSFFSEKVFYNWIVNEEEAGDACVIGSDAETKCLIKACKQMGWIK